MNNIAKVYGGLGDATDADVLEGVTYSSENGIRRVGTGTSGIRCVMLSYMGSGAQPTQANPRTLQLPFIPSTHSCLQ